MPSVAVFILLLLSLGLAPLISALPTDGTLIWGLKDKWFCDVANDPATLYQFINEAAVQEFAEAMSGGQEAVIAAMQAGRIFTTLDGEAPETVYTSLFSTTSLGYEANEFFVTVPTETLMDQIVEAGEWLLEFFAAFQANNTGNTDLGHGNETQLLSAPPTTDAATPDFSLTFENFGPTTFNLSVWGYDIAAGLGTIITSPGPTLQGTGGVESLSWYQTLSKIAVAADGWVSWLDSNTGYWFGVQIHVPYQVLGLGTAPYYKVAFAYAGSNSSDADYHTPPGGPSAVFNFPTGIGHNITIRPEAAHTSLFLTITITT